MKLREAATWLVLGLFYMFCGSGVYWIFLSWFHSPAFAGVSGSIIPLLLLWGLWASDFPNPRP